MPPTFALRRGLDEFQLCRKLEDCKGAGPGTPAALRFLETVSALVFLRSCITNPEQERKLRLWLQVGTHSEKQFYDGLDVLEHIAKLVVSGQLVVAGMGTGGEVTVQGILRGGGGTSSSRQSSRETTPLEDEMARRESATTAEEVIIVGEPEPETTWIEIELFDKNGMPVSNERYKLTLPDGSVKWGRLSSDGRARVERLQPGSCQVTFPDRDEEVWEVG